MRSILSLTLLHQSVLPCLSLQLAPPKIAKASLSATAAAACSRGLHTPAPQPSRTPARLRPAVSRTRSAMSAQLAYDGSRAFSAATPVADAMTPEQKYLFDLNGFIIIRGVLSEEEIAAAHAAIDAHTPLFKERAEKALRNTRDGTPLAGDGNTPRLDLGGMLGWPKPHCDIFRKMLCHPKLVPYLKELCGEGYRLDHQPLAIASEKGAEGFSLHGGTISAEGAYTPYLAYTYSHGKMHNNLLAASFSLVDHPAGSGGFIAIPGSHKANFPTPPALIDGSGHADLRGVIVQPETKAGDVILFSEGTVHGAAAWNMDYQRRLVLYRFAPSFVGYGRAYTNDQPPRWPASYYEGMSAEEMAVLEPPYNVRLDRPLVTSDGHGVGTEVKSRSAAKKDFDLRVFDTKYF